MQSQRAHDASSDLAHRSHTSYRNGCWSVLRVPQAAMTRANSELKCASTKSWAWDLTSAGSQQEEFFTSGSTSGIKNMVRAGVTSEHGKASYLSSSLRGRLKRCSHRGSGQESVHFGRIQVNSEAHYLSCVVDHECSQ